MVPTSAVQRGPAGTFSYVIGDGDNVATAKPVVVTQQNETDAVIASGLTTSDRVVTTGFANLSDGAKVLIGKDEPGADRRSRAEAPSAAARPTPTRAARRMVRPRTVKPRTVPTGDGQKGQGLAGQGRRTPRQARGRPEGSNTASGNEQSGGAAKSQP